MYICSVLTEVFLIIEPECQAVENITVTACPLGGGRAVLDVSALPRGVYLLRLASDKGAASRRVVLL